MSDDRIPFVDGDPNGVEWRIPFIDGSFNFWELYDAGKWEPETYDVLQRFLTPASFLLDIGAWIGPVSLWAAELGATVFAYEPDPVAFEQLTHNTQGKAVLPINTAVTSSGASVHLGNPRFYGDSMSRVVPEGGIVVPSVTPELAMHGIWWSLVKVDIEGGELDILPTLAPLCARAGTPLYVSWHEPWWPTATTLEERQSWFDEFQRFEGGWGGWDTLLALPYETP